MNLYYEAPSDKCFNELKEKAIEVWNTHDNTYGYVDEKVARIKSIQNIKDNFMYIVAMFDTNNRIKLSSLLSKETNDAIKGRMS